MISLYFMINSALPKSIRTAHSHNSVPVKFKFNLKSKAKAAEKKHIERWFPPRKLPHSEERPLQQTPTREIIPPTAQANHRVQPKPCPASRENFPLSRWPIPTDKKDLAGA